MTVTRRHPALAPALAVLGLLAAIAAILPSAASAASAATRGQANTKVIRYRGFHAKVPASWPVVRLARHPHACVRFNRHAVYLGTPGAQQDCPTHAAGRTEAVLVSPIGAGRSPVPAGGSVARVVRRAARVTVTATWHSDPGAVRAALGVRSPARAARAFAARRPAPAADAFRPAARPHARANAAATGGFPTTGAGSPGATYTGLGFDACSTPSSSALTAWSASPFRALGVYIGGANMACSQPNLTAAWTSQASATGWHLIPIYVGLQAPSSGCGCATISATGAVSQGQAAASDAIAHAQAVGLGPGNPIYYDMEGYARGSSSPTVMAFLQAWTQQLHASGYLSGVYSSAASGIDDLVAENGTGYVEPDDIWVADWNNQQTTADSHVPASEWANHQRLHQYRGGHTDDYGGTSISVDSDYVDAATAAAGTLTTTIAAAPSVGVRPAPDGSIKVTPRWSGERGISSWRVLAGSDSGALTPAIRVRSGHKLPLVTRNAYRFFQVQAINAANQVVGSSAAVPTPPHVAIFGNSSFVPSNGPGGLPVACYDSSPCVVTTTIWSGKRRLVTTGAQHVPNGGGIVHFGLSKQAHRLVADAKGHKLPVRVVVRASSGRSASRKLNLVPFTISGRGPRKRYGSSPALRIMGVTDFVSNAWSGGVLAVCRSATPCRATTTLTANGKTIAPARTQTLGAGEVGYLSFRMNNTGHRMLSGAHGNQLGARVRVSTAAVDTTGGAGAVSASGAANATALLALHSYR